MDLRGKKIAVVGIGESGKAASLLLKQKGAEVYATDAGDPQKLKAVARELKDAGVFVETGGHTEDFIKGAQLVVVSPGVKDDSRAITIAEADSIPVVSEIELASSFCKAPITAVTGTNGKTTIVTLIGLMLKQSGINISVCGNIGDAFCGEITDMTKREAVVLEASSFQLKRIRDFRPKVSAITNITQNHFDWHPDIEDYLGSKKNIFKNQGKDDFVVLNYDDPNLKGLKDEIDARVYFFSMDSKVEGCYLDEEKLILNMDGKELTVCRADDIMLKGSHNIANILCACLCAYLSGAKPDAIKEAACAFKGLKHRFQDIAAIDGVRFIDDSKATTVDACRAALSSCEGNVILIAGGRDKGSDFSAIRGLIAEKVKAVVLIGEAKDKIKKALKGAADIYDASCMEEAASTAGTLAGGKGIVLLSPMCASFDMYSSYKERGEAFCTAVDGLKKETGERTPNSPSRNLPSVASAKEGSGPLAEGSRANARGKLQTPNLKQ